jgi:norsolorinic acid ketoreductase
LTLTLILGIGLGLVRKYSSRSNTIVIAAVRDPSNPSSKALASLSFGNGSKIIIVKLDNANTDDPSNVVKSLITQHGIDRIDIVIANAGMAEFYGPALATPMQGFKDHLTVNTVAALALFQATWPLLKKSSSPKFVPVSSTVGGIGDMEKWPMSATAYGSSKAALNWLTRNIHIEHPSLIAFPIHPGYVVLFIFYVIL